MACHVNAQRFIPLGEAYVPGRCCGSGDANVVQQYVQAAQMIANRVERHIDRVFVPGIGLQGHQSA